MAASRSSGVTPSPDGPPRDDSGAPAPGAATAGAPRRARGVRWALVAAFAALLGTVALAIAWGPAVLVVHAFTALACAFLAPSRSRRAYVGLHAGLAFGVFALARLLLRPPRKVPPPGSVEPAVAFCGVFDFMLLCGLAQSVVEDRILRAGRIGEPPILALLAAFVGSALALVVIHRAALFRYLTNVRTSVALVSYLALGSLAMTLILQQPDAEKAWLQDRRLAPLEADPATGRPITARDKEYVKFMAAETGLVYGFGHLFEKEPSASGDEREEEDRLRRTFGETQGHNIAVRNAHERFLRAQRLEKQALADRTGDALRPFFDFCRATRLYEVRRAWWFVVGVLDLLAVCLVLVCVDRWKRRTKRYSFYFAHAGLVLVIVGRHFTDDQDNFLRYVAGESRRGNLDLIQGQPQNLVLDDFLQPSWRLPFEVRLDRFEVDYYKHWAVHVPDDRFGTLSNDYLPRQGKRLDVRDATGGLWTLTALEHHLSVDVSRRLHDDPEGPWRGAIRATVTVPKAPFFAPRPVLLVPDLSEAADAHLGRTALAEDAEDTYLRAVWADDDAAFERETLRPVEPAPFGRLLATTGDGTRFSVDVGAYDRKLEKRVPGVGRVVVDVELLARNWSEAVRSAENRGDLPLWMQSEGAPMLQATVGLVPEGSEDGGARSVRLIADPTGIRASTDLDAAGFSGWSFRFLRDPGPVLGSYSAKVVIGPGGRAALVVPEPSAGREVTATPLSLGATVPVGSSGAALRVDAVFGRCAAPLRVTPKSEREKSVVEDDFATARHDYVSATRFRVTPPEGGGAPAYDAWITSVDPWPLRFGARGEMSIGLDEEFGVARDYRSYVTILEGSRTAVRDGVPALVSDARGNGRLVPRDGVEVLEGGEERLRSRLVQVNDPLWWRGYKLYQSRFNATVPEFSGLIVKRDRGLAWIYLGLPLTFTGILWMLIVDPALARRRVRRKAGAGSETPA